MLEGKTLLTVPIERIPSAKTEDKLLDELSGFGADAVAVTAELVMLEILGSYTSTPDSPKSVRATMFRTSVVLVDLLVTHTSTLMMFTGLLIKGNCFKELLY